MKTLLAICALLLTAIQPAVADLPAMFDPRSDDQNTVQGACYVIHPTPVSSNYLVVSMPLDRNLKHEWFTAEAVADPSLKVDSFAGQLVHLEATRTKPKERWLSFCPECGPSSVSPVCSFTLVWRSALSRVSSVGGLPPCSPCASRRRLTTRSSEQRLAFSLLLLVSLDLASLCRLA